MHRTRMASLIAAAAAFGLAGMCAAQQAGTMADTKDTKIKPLKIGDPARDIDIAHWVKPGVLQDGKTFTPITTFEQGKVYVLEFWATWCGPCIGSMPHLTELQEQYKDYDVTFIGVSDETLPTVVSFLFKEDKRDKKIHNDRIGYTLTTDPDGSVYNDYFKAAGQSGIPCSFIIGKDSKVEWIGHPMTMDKPLEAIVHDKWDRQAFQKTQELETKIEKAMQQGKFDEALTLLDKALELDAENSTYQWRKFYLLLVQKNNPTDAYPIARDMIKQNWENAGFLNQIAWMIADSPEIKTRDLEVALKAATRAVDLTAGEDPAILDTLARVYYEKGNLKNAIKWQRQAVKHAEDDMMGQEIQKTLEKYENEQ